MIVYMDILQICLEQVEASWVGNHRVKILIDQVMARGLR
jgi:hypothetical protein